MKDPTQHDGWAWPMWGEEDPHPPTRRERISRILGPGVWLVFLISPITDVLSSHRSPLIKATVVVLVVVYGASYMRIAGTIGRCGHRHRVLAVVWLSIFPIALSIILGPDDLILFTYAVSTALMTLPRNAGVLYGLSTAAGVLIATRIHDGHTAWGDGLTLAVLTGAMAAFGALLRTISELKRAQDKMAKLAVAEERSRLARDLHDVLGHSLTTITVKAGLARRVLETSADRDRAIAEVRDVEELARQAMSEVRATVSGYRTATLPAELVGARAALNAAGIAADLPRAVDNVAAGLQETFAYVLREGVTNVIRHSGASRCEVRLGKNWLEVRDNGKASVDCVTSSRESGGGHGLSGLAERVAECGGELDAQPLPTGGFLLRVDAPEQSGKPPERAGAEPGNGVVARPSVGLA
ncbi:MAG TPA: histidine kinase [Pseudonocardiaceae bacterium]|nr:histidine kinase [Pseudonocardiaceae bacterium]